VLRSLNGAHWDFETLPVDTWCDDINVCNDTFIVVGEGGNLFQLSVPLLGTKEDQTITFQAIEGQITTDTVVLDATASSGLNVSYSVVSGPAIIAGGRTLSFTGEGLVSVVASQAGDDDWNPAPEVTNTFAVSKAEQADLDFAPPSPQTYNTTNLLSTTGGSGTGTVSYAVLSGPGEIVGADGLKATAGTGEIAVEATRAADDLYLAQTAFATVTVAKAEQTIDFPAIGDKLTMDAVGLAATASSGLPVAFAVASGPATISGGTNLTFTGEGAVSVVAFQAGDANWNAAPDVTNTFNVSSAQTTSTLGGNVYNDLQADGILDLADPALANRTVFAYDELSTGNWVDLIGLVDPVRDTTNAAWNVNANGVQFGAGKPRACATVPLQTNGNYDLEYHITITQSKETVRLYLPVGDRHAILDIKGDLGNTGSPTATIKLLSVSPSPAARVSRKVLIGTNYAFICKVRIVGADAVVEIFNGGTLMFSWVGQLTDIAATSTISAQHVGLETAYYTYAQIYLLRLRPAFSETILKDLTDSAGAFTLNDVPSRVVALRHFLPEGWQETKGVNPLELVGGVSSLTNVFLAFNESVVEGYVFNDTNLNCVLESSEPKVYDAVVFKDDNFNGSNDTGEISFKTAANGRWIADRLIPGSYQFCVLPSTNWSDICNNPQVVSISGPGATHSGKNFALVAGDVCVIRTSAGANGFVAPSGIILVARGSSTSIVVRATEGAHISQIQIDGRADGVCTPHDTARTVMFSNVISNHELTASFNLRPAILMTASPTSGVAPLRVAVDFSGSSDPDGTIARSEFDKDGDGLFETVMNGAGRTVVTYSEPGIYTATGVVCDAYGASASSAVRIEVLGRNPEAILTASPTNGAAPLSVSFVGTNSTAAANHQIAVYEWDFNGDGRIDRITATGLTTYVYASPGNYQAVLRVTDDQGLTGSATLAISVEPPVLVPPTVILTASTNAGYLPLDIAFTAEATDDGQVVQYRWDFDGDGSIDLVSSNNTANYRYTVAGTYNPRVVVVDNDGLSASDTVQIQVSTEPEKYKVWLTQPKDGDRIWGNAVTIDGHVAPAKDTVSVQFQYKPAGESVWVDLGAPIYPQPRDYTRAWDVTGLANGATYHLRAVATLEAQQVATSETYSVAIDSGEEKNPGKVTEGDVGGTHTRQATFDSGQTLNTRAFDGTGVVIPAGTVESNTTVEIVLVGANTNDANGSAQGQANINANRKVSLENDPDLSQMLTITIPYPDADQNGYVDGTAVPELTLTVHWYDTDSGQWRKAYSSTVYPDDNYVQAVVHHLTEFGVFGTMNLLAPANGGVLETFTSESPDGATKALNLTDGNTVSYWRSESTPETNQVFVYSFTNYMGAVLTKAVFNNDGDNGSRDIEVQTSMDGVNFDTVASGILLNQESAQEFPIANVVCRTVKLVVSSGATADAWELAEFAVHGTMTDDPDGDGMADAWEMQYFGDFSRDGTGDNDEEGLLDGQEHDFGTSPLLQDTDGDGQTDWAESIAGTGGTDEQDFFSIKEISPATESLDPLVLYWDTVSGRTYRLLYGLSMTGNWDAATQVLETPGDGQRKSYTNENSDRNGFYRLSVEKP
jgi:PKD repeat protein